MNLGRSTSTISKTIKYDTFIDSDLGSKSTLKVYLESTVMQEGDRSRSELPSDKEMSVNEEEWLQEEKLPIYKNIGEFLVNSVSGYMLMYGAYSILGYQNHSTEILSSALLSTLPYFTTRVAGGLVSTWLSKSSTESCDYKHLYATLMGTVASAVTGFALGASGAFKENDLKNTAFLSGIGMFAGKTVEVISNNVSFSCDNDFYQFRLNRNS